MRHLCLGFGLLCACSSTPETGSTSDGGSSGEADSTSTGTGSSATTERGSSAGADESSSSGVQPTGWRQRLQVTSPVAPDETLVDLPVLVVLEADRFDFAEAAPEDLRFYAGDVQIPYEVERWDPEGRTILWVRVPSLVSGTAELALHYGDPAAPPPPPPEEVWSNGYGAVWHFSDPDDAPTFRDSTAFGNDASATDLGVGRDDGPLGGSVSLERDGELQAAHATSFNYTAFTLEAWVRLDGVEGLSAPVQRHAIYKAASYTLDADTMDDVPRGTIVHPGGSTYISGVSPVIRDQWTQLRFVNRTDGIDFYVDGQGVSADFADTPALEAQPVILGRDLVGALDEVRLASIARTEAWIAVEQAAYEDTLITFGPAEAL